MYFKCHFKRFLQRMPAKRKTEKFMARLVEMLTRDQTMKKYRLSDETRLLAMEKRRNHPRHDAAVDYRHGGL